ncbi:MAG: 16S rRNA (cytidine(1402)-2'-O)-methyltransferase [Vicinamibacterales bacterium]
MDRSHQPPATAGGRLSVVATPIGNLEDITLRALRTLREADLVCAEDTRRTGNLLRHFQIGTPLLSLHAHNEVARIPGLLARLEKGERLALVTDAGMPGLSDPGMRLVTAAREAGKTVEIVPGASAVTTALAACGLADQPFAFLGFPGHRSKDRKKFFSELDELRHVVVVCFEAPHRLLRLLEELKENGANRPIYVARELTKLHEEVVCGRPSELLAVFSTPRGEFTLVIPPAAAEPLDRTLPDDTRIVELFGQITETQGRTKRERARALAEELGVTTKEVYQALERHKNSVE